MPKIQKADNVAVGTLPQGEVVSVSFDETENSLTVTTKYSFDYPDEAVQNRLGKVPKDESGNPTGEPRPVTSRTYGKISKVFLGFSDAENNPMMLSAKIHADTKEAEAEGQTSEEEV